MFQKPLFILCLLLCISCNSTRKDKSATDLLQKEAFQIREKDGEELITFPAKITRIVDGDTAEMLYHQLTITIRLAHIDAPESYGDQPFGEKAEDVLKRLCGGKTVTIRTTGEFDSFGRLIAVIIDQEGVNINKAMVGLGYAWHYKEYSDNQQYDALQEKAQDQNRGLWQLKSPVPPWEFR